MVFRPSACFGVVPNEPCGNLPDPIVPEEKACGGDGLLLLHDALRCWDEAETGSVHRRVVEHLSVPETMPDAEDDRDNDDDDDEVDDENIVHRLPNDTVASCDRRPESSMPRTENFHHCVVVVVVVVVDDRLRCLCCCCFDRTTDASSLECA